ncbi:MAG: hypothetical protein M1839_000365 [Geoglossum umbratile]|nr:MAG: hypothetical protein M1839_000365 [Geoglossum umbratile]
MDFQYRLPPELWAMVFQKLPSAPGRQRRNAIKNVRLTCRLFEKLATPFLLTRICCASLSKPLATLTAVSLHPVLSRSVKEVVYVCERYKLIETLVEYKEALDRTQPQYYLRFEKPGSNEENLKTAFSQYGQRYNDQTAVENSGGVIARLCPALMRMPNVEKITVSPNFDYFVDSYRNSIDFLLPTLVYNEAFLLMARVLSLTGVKIRKFNVEPHYSIDRRSSGGPFRGISQTDLSLCCDAFRGLREVTVTVNQDADGWVRGDLARILSCATDLESLYVYGSSFTIDATPKCFLSTMTWSRLTSLHLDGFTLDQGRLLDFLRRHSDTLEDLGLSWICLSNGSWKSLLEGMKSSLSLRTVSINAFAEEYHKGMIDDVFIEEAALEDYLLGDGPHPLSEQVSMQ